MRKVIISLLLLTCLFLPADVYAETKSVNLNADTYGNEAYADDPRGGVGSVTVSNHPIQRFGYLKFPEVDIPEDAIIDKAVFKFKLHEQNYADNAKLNLGPVRDDWTESGLTWNNKPAIYNDKAIEATIQIADSGWKEIEITSIFNHWQDTGNKGLFIYPYGYLYGTPENEFAFSFRSKESPDFGLEEAPAKLEVEYHLPPSPSPSPEASSTEEPSPSAGITESPDPEPTVIEEAEEGPEASPEEASPSASPKGSMTLGQRVIGIFSAGLLLIAGIIGIGFLMAGKKKKERKKEGKKVEKKAVKKKTEETETEEDI